MITWILISQSSHLCRILIQRNCSTLQVTENSSHWCLVKVATCKPHMDLSVTQWGPVRGDSACGVMFSGWLNDHREIGLTIARISLLFSQHELYIRAYHMLSDFPEVSARPTQTRTVNTHAHKHGSQVQVLFLREWVCSWAKTGSVNLFPVETCDESARSRFRIGSFE